MSDKDSNTADFPRKFGKYHLLSHLAQGGMGALYLAVTGDRGFERLLCIKTVLPHLADKEYVARFRDEAKIVVQLSHGNLIPVFDAGQVDGELFLAMDFVKGKDLRAVWNQCAKKAVAFPIDVAVYITKELCRGLGYAHGFGDIELVHRDVSPPNVLISYGGEVKLTDFGLAASTLKTEKTLPGIIYGKVAYMSPEQARGHTLDRRSDIYACGIILWELLTGRQLFPPGKEQPQDLLARARDPKVMPASERAPRVPKDLDAILSKALKSEPDDRYNTAEEFRDALGAWLAVHFPATDVNRIEGFVGQLFEEDIVREEKERQALILNTRERVKTLPPTDELRRLLELAGDGARETIEKASDRRKGSSEEEHPSRRAPDQGNPIQDRRGARGRRMVDAIEGTTPGVAVTAGESSFTESGKAVAVMQAGPDGATAVSGGVATAAAMQPDAPPSEFIGKILENRYKVEKLIGEGGMGRVYLAEHIEIGKKVAVKVLHPVYGRMPDLVERFRREARAASRIGHPNIVDVTDSGTMDDGSVYFVMEYLEGVELAGVIDRQGAIEVRRALDISTQVCRALSAAHCVGIIHRDLKPENIFLTVREGTSDFVKILDFGIAKSSEAEEARSKKLTSPGMAMGTPEYMAPEQAAGKIADERCDVYALGAILYEMLTGSAPYEGDNFLEILTKKATIEPVPPRELRSDIPEDVEELLMRAMARSPDDRPPSMDALEYELTKCFAGRGVAVTNILGISHDETGNRFKEALDTPAAALAGSNKVDTPVSLIGVSNTEALQEDLALVGAAKSRWKWPLLAGLLVVAVAAIVLVAKGEDSDALSPEDVSAGKVQPSAVLPARKGKSAKKKHRDRGDDRSRKDKRGKAKTDRKKDNGTSSAAKPSSSKKASAKPATSNEPPKSKKEAKRLLSLAKKDVSGMHLDSAKQLYKRVLRGRHLRTQAALGLAKVAFESKNYPEAAKYAKLAGNGENARVALADAYFKMGDHRKALSIYEKVLVKSPQKKSAKSGRDAAKKKLGI